VDTPFLGKKNAATMLASPIFLDLEKIHAFSALIIL
jgi:hypothetical protein